MKTLRIIIVLFALFISLKGGKAFVIPGNNLLVYRESVAVIFDVNGREITRIPADLIVSVGSINDDDLKPQTEL